MTSLISDFLDRVVAEHNIPLPEPPAKTRPIAVEPAAVITGENRP
jgi:hypothetical protein